MDPRFPALNSQRQIKARPIARALQVPQMPSLPWGEWLIAAAILAMLLAL